MFVSRTLLKLTPDDAVSPLPQAIYPSTIQRQVAKFWCESQPMSEALQPLTQSSGFGPGLQSTKLSFNCNSSSTINSCLSSSHTLWASSPLYRGLFGSIPVLLSVQVTADWCCLPVMHCLAFTKSLHLFCFVGRKYQLPESPTWVLLMTGIT